MTSLELTKGCEPKSWLKPIWLVFCIYFIVGLVIVGPLYLLESQSYYAGIISILSGVPTAILVIYFSRKNEKRSLGSFGIHKEYWLKKYCLGILIGIALIGATLFIDRIMGNLNVEFNKNVNYIVIIFYIVAIFLQTMAEEIIFRGYLQNAIATIKGKKFGIIAQAIIFSLFHVGASKFTFFNLISIFLVALFLGLVFWYTDSIFTVSAIHFVWNVVLIVLLEAVPKKNITINALFTVSENGDKVSSFDPTIIVILIALAILYYIMKNNKKFRI